MKRKKYTASKKEPTLLLHNLMICIYIYFSKERKKETNKQNGMCVQRRLRSAWASAQSDQSFRCPHEEKLDPYLPIERASKTMITLGGCPGWSESSLGAKIILLV